MRARPERAVLARGLTAIYSQLCLCSEFFWLGLVASLLLGIIITIIRSRNARLAAVQADSADRAPRPLESDTLPRQSRVAQRNAGSLWLVVAASARDPNFDSRLLKQHEALDRTRRDSQSVWSFGRAA